MVLTAALAAACSSSEPTPIREWRSLKSSSPRPSRSWRNAQPSPAPPPAAASAAAQRAAAPAPASSARPPQTAKPAASTATGKSAASAAATAQAQKEAAEQQARDAEAQRLIEEQKALNARQAETNAQLQKELERLKPRDYTVPAGTVVAVRLPRDVSTERMATGSTFDGLLEHDLKSGETVLAKAGTRVNGFVVTSDPGGRVKDVASLTVGVRSIVGVKGNAITVTTDSFTADAQSTKKKDAVRTGVATGVGALIGGIAGGGKGAAIGAGVGAGAGVGTAVATRGDPAIIPAESLIEFKLQARVTVTVQP